MKAILFGSVAVTAVVIGVSYTNEFSVHERCVDATETLLLRNAYELVPERASYAADFECRSSR